MDRFLSADVDPNLLSPLDLAFIGDCVYELFVREALVCEGNRPTGQLHQNMTVASYHAATGFEALFGYLYLNGELSRLRELFAIIYHGQSN